MSSGAEIGIVLGFFSGLSFALGDVPVRAASTGLSPRANLLISLLIGTPAAALAAVVAREELPSPQAAYLYVLAGLSAAVVFALSSPTVRAASAVGGAPLWGMSISYATAIPFAAALGWRDLAVEARLRQARFMVAAALSTAVAQMLRYSALSVARVATVVVAIGMFPVHTVVLSALILRRGYGERLGINHAAAALAVIGIACTSLLR